ncbi:alpha/beta fold hydrolase [Gloeocapsa sp. PCC 73106]|uniref:alpha/beta fold hydrolase n=1 Tax=Gloeocapsa sp. PCC 73106 TaxID=102232 RepID=UPI0002ACB366|nr:alpha/beta fold hydrolase [Gloeocapsa sp. PCC 73106]ELR99700.1 putative hydrolase or acyltransferase of alpha/beta superfamily [Gloeocapsa sp. PCC 73106]
MGQYWYERIGHQRDWVWRGWQTRYTYLRARADSHEPPLIFLHGFGAAIEHWRHNLPVLSENHSVYALDLLGFGGSRKADTNYTIDLWVEQLHDFWATFIGQPVILVGNSIGSLICLMAAARYPEMADRLVMLTLPDISIRQEIISPWLLPLITGLENLVASPPLLIGLFRIVRSPAVLKRWLGLAYYNQEKITPELVEIIAAPPQDIGATQAFLRLFQSLRKPEFSEPVVPILTEMNIPMLLIWGKKDRIIPPLMAKLLAELNPCIDLIELENVGHCPHDECPEEFNQILTNWLKLKNSIG